MKRQRLDAGVRFDFDVYGIVTVFRGFKLAWVINKFLKVNLSKKEDLTLRFIDYDVQVSHYRYAAGNTMVRLLKNKSHETGSGESLYLIPELPSIDFFLTISSSSDSIDRDDVVNRLRLSNGIEYVTRIDLSTVKSAENFLE